MDVITPEMKTVDVINQTAGYSKVETVEAPTVICVPQVVQKIEEVKVTVPVEGKPAIFAGEVDPAQVLGADPDNFVSVLRSVATGSSATVDFGKVSSEGDGPPMHARLLESIRKHSSMDKFFPADTDTHLNLLFATQNSDKPWTHCNLPHATWVVAGEMRRTTQTGDLVDQAILKAGDLVICDGGQYYAAVSESAPLLAVLLTVGGPLPTSSKKIGSIGLAKVSQLAKNGKGDWRFGADGEKIDWDADGKLDAEARPGQTVNEVAFSYPPTVVKAACSPAEVLGMKAPDFMAILKSLATEMPMQVHFEAERLSGTGGPGLVRRAINSVVPHPAVKELFDNAGSDNVRLKMRFSGGGKFIHRNRYPRRQAFCLLEGEMWWLLVESQNNEGRADEFLGAVQNDNWNGYRTPKHPVMLTLEEMEEMQRNLPEGVQSRLLKVCAGDCLVFDGRWWHATSYKSPVISMFLTPGKDMEVAVKEHDRRMKMPKQAKLKICSFYEGL